MSRLYQNQECFVVSMHQKERAIRPAFETILGCNVVEAKINTDLLGTFTGEIERTLSPFECVKKKCYQGLELHSATLALANEGTFGPHPFIPFAYAGRELLFFVDRQIGFELTLSKLSLETNFDGNAFSEVSELFSFAQKVRFPSHALIVRPNIRKDNLIYKGIQTAQDLETAFIKCLEASSDRTVWVETDMRAHMNPTRMKVIGELAYEMADRLATYCPSCHTPGWGIVKKVAGLKCGDCGAPTELIQSEMYGCSTCSYQEIVPLKKIAADPGCCPFCNP